MSPRRGPRRPIVGVRISDAGITAIDQLAQAEGVGRSEMIRRLLSEALTARAKYVRARAFTVDEVRHMEGLPPLNRG